MDMNDRSLRHIVIGLGGSTNGVPRETGFDIVPSSEIMAILCLSRSYEELKDKIRKTLVGFTYDDKPVIAGDLKVEGAVTALLKYALLPNLVQTTEGVPAIIHGGPFANIAQGTNSIIGTDLALRLADHVVTEAGFGFDLGEWGLPLGVLVGMLAGILLAALMRHILTFHMGYNLYNTGTTGGFVGLVVYMFMRGFGLEIQPQFLWSTQYTSILSWLTLSILGFTILLGLLWGGKLAGLRIILQSSGRLSSDYVEMTDLGSTLVNMGLVGLIALGYIHLVGGDVNGATMAGVFTVYAFGALGKHPRNIIPIMLGVYLACFTHIWEPTEAGPLLAALFCTTLAPLAGRFGFLAGLAAGALHLPMVMHVGSLHGYMNLYNTGFAGGLAMLIIVGFIKGLKPRLLEDG